MLLIVAFYLFAVHDAHWSLYLGTIVWWLFQEIGAYLHMDESKCRYRP